MCYDSGMTTTSAQSAPRRFTRDAAVVRLAELSFEFSAPGCEYVHPDGRRGRFSSAGNTINHKGTANEDGTHYFLMTPGGDAPIEVLGGKPW
jgi:hypothetical protein